MTTKRLANKLDKFNSHSVHYVILAARNTQDLRGFTETSDQAQIQALQAINNAKFLGDEVKLANTSGVFLMIDTRRFSQFTLDNFSIDTYMSGFSVPGSNSPNSTAQDMGFTVLDSTGISFANFLMFLMDKKLGVSFDGMTLLVKVLFVGQEVKSPTTSTTTVVSSIAIPAIFKSIEMDLNGVAGKYICTCFPLSGMVSNSSMNAKWTSIGTASSFFSGNGNNTLGGVVNAFERVLNQKSMEKYEEIRMLVKKNNKDVEVPRFGRPVQYMITLPTGWDQFTFSGPSQGGAKDIDFKSLIATEEAKRKTAADKSAAKTATQNPNAAHPAKDSYVTVDPSLTVTEVLDKIFEQTIEVAKLGNFTRAQDQSGNIKFYKQLVTVTSDDASFTVHVDVVEYVVPNVDLVTTKQSQAAQVAELDKQLYQTLDANNNVVDASSSSATKKIPRNFIELDYIFSGTNLDVLSLDLKIENLNWLLQQGVKLGQGNLFSATDAAGATVDGEGAQADKQRAGGLREHDPILLPQRTYLERTNMSNLGAGVASKAGEDSPQAINQQYVQNLSAFYNTGPLEVKLELRGNPEILERIVLDQIPRHVSAVTALSKGVVSEASNATKTEYRKTFETDVLKLKADSIGKPVSKDSILSGPSFVSSPVFVKVNVFGPNVDFTTNMPVKNAPYTQKLFYDNYYMLSKVTSKIDGGKFTQELSLLTYSVYGAATQPNTDKKATKVIK